MDAEITRASPMEIIRSGMGYIPERPHACRHDPRFQRGRRTSSSRIATSPDPKGPFLDFRQIPTYARRLVEAFSVKTPSLDTTGRSLSGANIQKINSRTIL